MDNLIKHTVAVLVIFILLGCNKEEAAMFSLMNSDKTNIHFSNDLPYTEEFNTYTYRNFYNGGGVALGDINNDGLVDIYLTGNIVDSKLYLNQGNWNFEDITEKAGVACSNVWSTGASFVDINGDGLLDLYVCKAGKPEGDNRHNELFINQGDLTFEEQSKEYGLDITGLSIHSAFFDYDKDGDLDCYLLNNSIRSVGGFDLNEGLRNIPDSEGNKLLRNDEGKFVDVTQEAGMYSSNIGYGLGITLSDFNQDNWPDVFISNDFFERDYLYLNNKNGTFEEVGDKRFQSMSMGSMGADACDLNNDLLPDLFVTEMLPANLERKKTKAQYETWDKYISSVKNGYHHQYSRNILQQNIGNEHFLEVGRIAGVEATEWSWAALIQDFDNDGLKDLFVSNGIYKDLLDKDYINYFANDVMIKSKIDNKEDVLTTLIDSIPSFPVQNYMYRNEGNFNFSHVSDEWGLTELTFSNGSAYGDLDNDGDLDLVINNANMESFLYKNNIDTTTNRSIQFTLVGKNKNRQAIGSKVILKYNEDQSLVENYTSKGFESSVDSKIHFGVGNVPIVDSVIIIWPNDEKTVLTDLPTNKVYTIDQSTAENGNINYSNRPNVITHDTSNLFRHNDISINLFSRERLNVEMNGFDGPAIATGDVNGDNIDGDFCGGGKGQGSVLYVSISGAESYRKVTEPFDKESNSESVEAILFDSDNDGDLDLFVGHGGKTYSIYSPEMNDVLYLNDGMGNYVKKENALEFPYPVHTGGVAISDYNKDGLNDIVVAEKMKNNLFGLPGSCFLFKNMGNNIFVREKIDSLEGIGMISSVELTDVNNDNWPDIVMAGKWMPITIIINNEGTFSNNSRKEIIPQSSGLWNVIHVVDIDHDGDDDILCGNEGLNNFYSIDMKMYINDFDRNGTAEQIICEKIGGEYYPIHDIDEMFSQLPFLKKKFGYYNDFAKADIVEIFNQESIDNAMTFDLEELRSLVLINEGGTYKKIPLPREVQYSSVYAFLTKENKENKIDIFLGGNNYKVKPQFGKQDASLGWQLNVELNNDSLSFSKCDPLFINGQIRDIESMEERIIFGINNDRIKIIYYIYD